jgi:eukaryotic-like serine/threonine-protein kinase
VIAAAAAPVPFLLPRAGLLWSVPVLAPLLGTIALAPAFIGVAALASTHARRAGLAAAGLWWVLVGEVLTGRVLLFGAPDKVLPRGNWDSSISAAASDALQPLLTSPALAPVVAWAAGAVALALVVRGRWLAVDMLGAGACAAALIAAHAALGDALAADLALDHARGGVAGCIAAGLVVIVTYHATAGHRPALAHRPPRVTTA